MSFNLRVGDHLVVRRGLYSHHGIYVGNWQVVHFSGGLGPKNKLNALIRRDHIDDFTEGSAIRVQPHNTGLSGHEIAQRALSRIGEDGYDLFKNNCEHFVNWCVSGTSRSNQIAVAGGVTLVALLVGCVSWLSSSSDES